MSIGDEIREALRKAGLQAQLREISDRTATMQPLPGAVAGFTSGPRGATSQQTDRTAACMRALEEAGFQTERASNRQGDYLRVRRK